MKIHSIQLYPLGKEIQVNDNTPLIDILHEFGIEFPCGGHGTCGKCKVKLLNGKIEITPEHRQKLDKLKLTDDWRLACKSKCTDNLTLEIDQFNHIILADESEFSFIPDKGFGIAVDLGTTTLVAQLIDLSNAKVIAVETLINPQVKYGADLISRISACIGGHAEEMKILIRTAIGLMISRMLKKHPMHPEKIVLVGNTAMQLIFSGKDVSPLSAYPFDIGKVEISDFKIYDLEWNLNISGGIQFYPSIGSFVGSDILAGILATGLHKKEKYSALIDLGTNGEIAVGNRERIVCASTAAGPAFEGANISVGMRAVTGAISSLILDDGTVKAHVIGNTKPKGICGSALIDAIAILRKLEMIGMFGDINTGEKLINLTGEINLLQVDINEFLLAKAAIAAGLQILSKNLSISVDEINDVYLAGGFGNYVNLNHLVETGMIELPVDRIHKLGNTALIGAKMFLFEGTEVAYEILRKTQHINIERDSMFQDIYVEKMMI